MIDVAGSTRMSDMAFLDRAREYNRPPPPGSPHSVAVPDTKQDGRSEVYRHWRFKNGVLKTLDPKVSSRLEVSKGLKAGRR